MPKHIYERESFAQIIRIMFGSWWSIIIHTIIFLLIILVWKDMLLFTTIVSIEAIYIGIFILMAEYDEERIRERKERLARLTDRRLVKEDVHLTENVFSEINEIKKTLAKMDKALKKQLDSK